MKKLQDSYNIINITGKKENQQIKELKYKVLSNLQSKVDDLTANGMEYCEAVNKAKESINNIDYLIDSNTKVYINKDKLENNVYISECTKAILKSQF
jgi:hypothetical protein